MNKLISHSQSLLTALFALAVLAVPYVVSAQINYTLQPVIVPTTFKDLLLSLLTIFIMVAIPIIVLFIIYSGFLYVTARGNVEQTQKATRSLTYSVIGGVIVIGAVAISQIIGNVVNSFTT